MKWMLLLGLFPLFASAQNAGIGTTTPQAKLEVKNPSNNRVLASSNGFIYQHYYFWYRTCCSGWWRGSFYIRP